MKKPVLSGNLTKKFFISLLEGDYLVSNVMETPTQPMFAQIIKPKAHRESQWKDIVAARANGRMCHVFASAKDYLIMSLEVPFPQRIKLIMSLILTEISNAGIAMVADSAISMLNPQTHAVEAHQKDWLKLLKVQRINAAVSYWGNIGAISGAQPFDEWLAARIKNNDYNDLPSLANYLASELNKATGNKPLLYDQNVGIHVAGYHQWQDGISRPMFFHVHNGHGHLAIKYDISNLNGQPIVGGISSKWEGEPRRLFQAHLDYPSNQRSLAANIEGLKTGYITRNGDYFPYLLISDGLNYTRALLKCAGVSLPRDAENLSSRLGYHSLIMQTVIAIYDRSSMARIIGGHVTALGISPDSRYVGESTRKSKFVSRRAAHLGL